MTLLEKSLAAIFALLLIATVINELLVWQRPGKDWRELTLRIRTWWVIIVLFSLALLSPNWLALTFFALVSFMALKEFLTLVPSRQSDRMPLFIDVNIGDVPSTYPEKKPFMDDLEQRLTALLQPTQGNHPHD
ncbi:phosphatidate cytidylyltransferase [Vibrio fluvialis]|uniref:phosphatidate cytidylyltransferase n=1 Tax=Vibrio fluvialis TaxID=676 RepID=UPI00192C4479|nr:phosphatidate cytidylyltransferase [Vibrio fluvialis]MBO1440279.1 phosphatidate cytidylyltransferase [Vibrio fluvialis]MBO1444652.1 phosphatidate cytidylyltransferase [Vibrio fluvialis]MBO1449017.1 phosphatidate cytidylyltransferase [Vibrio fluvialis]MBO1472916.1 phosphatidate cytidylyltransferase [Vibrio fluvialis]MBO1477278.1 phosphatidate cytidylyltransferase [Vibrio fluvialis]